jgi:GMP synthase-like glutamine amidotransferase
MPIPNKPRIGLILCDDVDESARQQYGTYAQMFQDSLDPNEENLDLVPIRCFEGETLPDPGDFDGYVISGSRYSVYEDRQWISDLLEFVRQCWTREVRVVGICFGHQVIAHALGGKTEKADVGWGFGIQTAKITHRQGWMTDTDTLNGDLYNLIVIHQDQVVEMPPQFRTIAENDFCPNSMIVADGKMLGIQGHPEFSKEFCRFRADYRRDIIGPEVYETTVSSLTELESHAPTVLKWVTNFLQQPAETR